VIAQHKRHQHVFLPVTKNKEKIPLRYNHKTLADNSSHSATLPVLLDGMPTTGQQNKGERTVGSQIDKTQREMQSIPGRAWEVCPK